MKIIGISNFANDSISDILICKNIRDGYSKVIVNLLNSEFQDQIYFFKVVEDSYKLYKFES